MPVQMIIERWELSRWPLECEKCYGDICRRDDRSGAINAQLATHQALPHPGERSRSMTCRHPHGALLCTLDVYGEHLITRHVDAMHNPERAGPTIKCLAPDCEKMFYK